MQIKDRIIKYIDENSSWLIKNILDIVSQNTVDSPPPLEMRIMDSRSSKIFSGKWCWK
ncbi:MAG: hypothetical protein ACYCXB_00370 [Candidatus Humimicrobiaceae bacterium]